jgi:hypothetical protein
VQEIGSRGLCVFYRYDKSKTGNAPLMTKVRVAQFLRDFRRDPTQVTQVPLSGEEKTEVAGDVVAQYEQRLDAIEERLDNLEAYERLTEQRLLKLEGVAPCEHDKAQFESTSSLWWLAEEKKFKFGVGIRCPTCNWSTSGSVVIPSGELLKMAQESERIHLEGKLRWALANYEHRTITPELMNEIAKCVRDTIEADRRGDTAG